MSVCVHSQTGRGANWFTALPPHIGRGHPIYSIVMKIELYQYIDRVVQLVDECHHP